MILSDVMDFMAVAPRKATKASLPSSAIEQVAEDKWGRQHFLLFRCGEYYAEWERDAEVLLVWHRKGGPEADEDGRRYLAEAEVPPEVEASVRRLLARETDAWREAFKDATRVRPCCHCEDVCVGGPLTDWKQHPIIGPLCPACADSWRRG